MQHITAVNLSNNFICTVSLLPPCTCEHCAIVHLVFPCNTACMYSCRSLELENNKIAQLPREISRLTSLTHLNVKHNKLVTLPFTLCLLKQLVRLDVAENPLESPDPRNVRRGISHVLNHLRCFLAAETSKILDLSGLALDALPPDCTTINFHTLILARNSIPELSATVSKLPNLTRLDVSSRSQSLIKR